MWRERERERELSYLAILWCKGHSKHFCASVVNAVVVCERAREKEREKERSRSREKGGGGEEGREGERERESERERCPRMHTLTCQLL